MSAVLELCPDAVYVACPLPAAASLPPEQCGCPQGVRGFSTEAEERTSRRTGRSEWDGQPSEHLKVVPPVFHDLLGIQSIALEAARLADGASWRASPGLRRVCSVCAQQSPGCGDLAPSLSAQEARASHPQALSPLLFTVQLLRLVHEGTA